MLKSMTGFGRYEHTNDKNKIIIEIKAVNHKFCDINMRMPKKLMIFENEMRTLIKKYISRGKLDIFITYENYINKTSSLKYNETLANEYVQYFERISKQFDIKNDIVVSKIIRCPEVLVLEEQPIDEDTIRTLLLEAVSQAVFKLINMRKVEGELLYSDFNLKLLNMKELVESIKESSKDVVKEYKEKLSIQLKELLDEVPIDESRLAMELAVFADRSCIDEEIVRLESHIQHMNKTLQQKDSVGRKLDFIAQEMNREANTILSKVKNLNISNMAIELKTNIEKIREQIQNVE